MKATPCNRRQRSASKTRALSEPLEARRLLATILTADASGNLYSVDTASGVATLEGNMGAGIDQIGSSSSVNNIGNLYATDGSLYQVNPATAAQINDLGPVGLDVTSLAASSGGVIYGATTALYSLSTSTGSATLVGNLDLPDQIDPDTNGVYANTIAGDLSFDNGILYLSAHIHDETAGDEFFSVSTTTGNVTLVGSIGVANVTGLALGTDGILYGVTSAGDLLSINPSTGAGTFVSTITVNGVTTGMTDAAPFVTPPPPPSVPPAASFTATLYTTNLNSSAATLIVQLTGGPATTAVDVSYQTADDSAVAGTNYVAESGTVDFPVGVTSEPLAIPVLNSQSLGTNTDFFVELTDPFTDTGASSGAPYVLVSPSTAEVVIQNVNSAFEISPATVSVNDSAATASVTVTRLGVASDEETVDFSTVYPAASSIDTQAVPGINYDTVLTTLTFQPGVTSQSVQIPILDSNTGVGTTENVLLQLTNPEVIQPTSGVATAQDLFFLGSPNSSLVAGTGLLAITNVESTLPTVSDVSLNNSGNRITSINIQFSEGVTQTSAQALTSYGLFLRDKDGAFGTGPRTALKLSNATYDASTDTVVLTPSKPLAENKIYQFVAYASNGVTNAAGNPLEGNGGAASATGDYSSFFGLGTHLKYIDDDGDAVSLKLSGPGLLDLSRSFNGAASSLFLDDTTPDTILTGSVKKGRYGDGEATIDLVGPTGGVNDELTKPPFIIVQLD